jgi:hypothetical protein
LENGSTVKCVGAFTFPISVPNVKNLNNRIYTDKLFTRLIAEGQGEGRFGLCDHASEKSNQPDGSTLDTFCVWRNMRFSSDRKLILADCYVFGTTGQHFCDAIDAGGCPGFSMVGYGDFLKDGETIEDTSYILDHPADWVLNPSAQVYGSLDDAIGEHEDKDKLVGKEPLQENTMKTKLEQLQEDTFRKQVVRLQKGADALPLDERVSLYTDLVASFDEGVAEDLKTSISEQLVILTADLVAQTEKANTKPPTTTKKPKGQEKESDEDGEEDAKGDDGEEAEKDEGGGIANFKGKKALPFKKKKDQEEPDGDEGDDPEEDSDDDGDEEDEKETKKELASLQVRFDTMAQMCDALREYSTKIGELYEAAKSNPLTTVSMDEYNEAMEALRIAEDKNTAMAKRIKQLKTKKDQQFNYQHNGDNPDDLNDPDSLSLPLIIGSHDAGDDNDDDEAPDQGTFGEAEGDPNQWDDGSDDEDELIEPLTNWLPQIAGYYKEMVAVNPNMKLIKDEIGSCRTLTQAQLLCLRMKDIIEPGMTMNREIRRGVTGTTVSSHPRSFAESKTQAEEHKLPRRKGWY